MATVRTASPSPVAPAAALHSRPGSSPPGYSNGSRVTSGTNPGTHSALLAWATSLAGSVGSAAVTATAVVRAASAADIPTPTSSSPSVRLPRPWRTTSAPIAAYVAPIARSVGAFDAAGTLQTSKAVSRYAAAR